MTKKNYLLITKSINNENHVLVCRYENLKKEAFGAYQLPTVDDGAVFIYTHELKKIHAFRYLNSTASSCQDKVLTKELTSEMSETIINDLHKYYKNKTKLSVKFEWIKTSDIQEVQNKKYSAVRYRYNKVWVNSLAGKVCEIFTKSTDFKYNENKTLNYLFCEQMLLSDLVKLAYNNKNMKLLADYVAAGADLNSVYNSYGTHSLQLPLLAFDILNNNATYTEKLKSLGADINNPGLYQRLPICSIFRMDRDASDDYHLLLQYGANPELTYDRLNGRTLFDSQRNLNSPSFK